MRCELDLSLNFLILEVSLKTEESLCTIQTNGGYVTQIKDVKVALCEAETKVSVHTFQKVNIMNFEVPLCRHA